VDDRILLIPPLYAPDWNVIETWPAGHAFSLRLKAFLPLDILLWPTLKGQRCEGDTPTEWVLNALRRQIRPEHHVLAIVSGEALLMALGEHPARSLIISGFFPSPTALAARGENTLAGAMVGVQAILSNPLQLMRAVMAGADEDVVERAAHEVALSLDRPVLENVQADEPLRNPQTAATLSLPTLYLRLPTPTPGMEERFAFFRSYIPDARHDELHEWGLHMHQEEGGHELANKVISFIEEAIASRTPERRVLTLLFTDIVGSTERAVELGDNDWRKLIEHHHSLVRAQLKAFNGREVDTAGDGFLAAFDTPAPAIRCAVAIAAAVGDIGLAVRAGLHTGEVDLTEGKVRGVAVHQAARVAARARAGEVLVSSTVRDLVAGSGFDFQDRGSHILKGLPGRFRLYVVAPRQGR
jgi:class 3 adenylate cyclase